MKKIISLTICGFILAATPLAAARWHYPIHPGDHVFDAVRFADSVRETAQMIKNVQQSYEKLRNAGIYNLPVNVTEFGESYNKAALKINELAENNTIININNSFKDYESYKNISINEAMIDNGEIEHRLRAEASERKLSVLQTAREALSNVDQRSNELNRVVTNNDEGVLAEHQKANAVAIINEINKIDYIRMNSASFADDLQSQEETFAAERLEEAKLAKAAFKGYDPYHPTEEQRLNMNNSSKDLGFLRVEK